MSNNNNKKNKNLSKLQYNPELASGPIAGSLGMLVTPKSPPSKDPSFDNMNLLLHNESFNTSTNNNNNNNSFAITSPKTLQKSGTFYRVQNGIKRFGSFRAMQHAAGGGKFAASNNNKYVEPPIVRNMKKWRAAVHVVRACIRLVLLANDALKPAERDLIQQQYYKYISKCAKEENSSSSTYGGPINSEVKLVHFLRKELGFVQVIEEEERRCGCRGITINDLLQYDITTWPIRMSVLCQVIGQLTKREEWQQQILASKSSSSTGTGGSGSGNFSQIPLAKLLFQQLAVEIPRDEAKSMARKRRMEELNGNERFGIEHPVMLPSSGDDDDDDDDDEDDVKYGIYNDDSESVTGAGDAIPNRKHSTTKSMNVFTEKWKNVDASTSNTQKSRHLIPTPPPSSSEQKGSKNKKTSSKKPATMVKRVEAALFVEVLERFEFPSEIVQLFKSRATSHPWLSQKALETILEDPIANAQSVNRLSALTTSISFSSIQAKRAKDRIQEASNQLVSVLWRRLAGGGGGKGGPGGGGGASTSDSSTFAGMRAAAFSSSFRKSTTSAANKSTMRSMTSNLDASALSGRQNINDGSASPSSQVFSQMMMNNTNNPTTSDNLTPASTPLRNRNKTDRASSASFSLMQQKQQPTVEGMFSSVRSSRKTRILSDDDDDDEEERGETGKNTSDKQLQPQQHYLSRTARIKMQSPEAPKEESFYQHYFNRKTPTEYLNGILDSTRTNHQSSSDNNTSDGNNNNTNDNNNNNNNEDFDESSSRHQQQQEVNRDSWKRKMNAIFGDARPPSKTTMAEFRFVELATPRRHQQQVKTEQIMGSESVGFATSEQRWWLRGVPQPQATESGRTSPFQNFPYNNHTTTRRQVFGQQQHHFGSPTSAALRPTSAHHQSTPSYGNSPSNSRPTSGRPTRPSSSSKSRSRRRRQKNHNFVTSYAHELHHRHSSTNNNHHNHHNNESSSNNKGDKPPWHVSSARLDGAPNPPLPLPGTPRRERDREGKKKPPPRPKWSKVNPFVDGKSWDDLE